MTYEFDGKKYEKASSHQKEWGGRLISELKLRGDERILDLGCGDGALTAEIAHIVPKGKVIGIDASESMIETARKHSEENLKFIIKDINDLDFEAEFDLIFSNAALHWIKNHSALFKNVFRSLRDGGMVRFNFAAEGNCSHFLRVIHRAIKRRRYTKYFEDFDWPWFMPDVKKYEKFVHQFPFREVCVWAENTDHFFADADTMIRWVEQPSLVPFLQKVDEPDKQTFRDFVIVEMVKETLQPDGRCFETFRRVNVFAVK